MAFMLVTLDVFHAPMSWLKLVAIVNILVMSVTLDVSHEPIGWLNSGANRNKLFMSVTRVVTMLMNGTVD